MEINQCTILIWLGNNHRFIFIFVQLCCLSTPPFSPSKSALGPILVKWWILFRWDEQNWPFMFSSYFLIDCMWYHGQIKIHKIPWSFLKAWGINDNEQSIKLFVCLFASIYQTPLWSAQFELMRELNVEIKHTHLSLLWFVRSSVQKYVSKRRRTNDFSLDMILYSEGVLLMPYRAHSRHTALKQEPDYDNMSLVCQSC